MARVLAVISGDLPLAEAARLLAPDLVCHMDRYTVHGTDVWFDWVEFLRWRAGGAVRVDLDHCVPHPDGTISAYGWLRVADARARTAQQNQARYRLEGGRIAEIWTTRENYEMIFGPKVRHPLRWFLVLLEMAVWRRLPWRGRARPSRNAEELGDRSRSRKESRRGGQPHGHPERREPDRERGRADSA